MREQIVAAPRASPHAVGINISRPDSTITAAKSTHGAAAIYRSLVAGCEPAHVVVIVCKFSTPPSQRLHGGVLTIAVRSKLHSRQKKQLLFPFVEAAAAPGGIKGIACYIAFAA